MKRENLHPDVILWRKLGRQAPAESREGEVMETNLREALEQIANCLPTDLQNPASNELWMAKAKDCIRIAKAALAASASGVSAFPKCNSCGQDNVVTVRVDTGFSGEFEYLCGACISKDFAAYEADETASASVGVLSEDDLEELLLRAYKDCKHDEYHVCSSCVHEEFEKLRAAPPVADVIPPPNYAGEPLPHPEDCVCHDCCDKAAEEGGKS